MKITKSLILVRHAHRVKGLLHQFDNGLSKRGKLQASQLAKVFFSRFGKADFIIVSSPKKRCIETVLPLVGGNESKLHLLSCLDEGGELTKKVDEFICWFWQNEAPLIVACSHGDLIPNLLKRLTSKRIELKKGAWAILEQKKEVMILVEVTQKF